MKIRYVDYEIFTIHSLKYIVQLINVDLVEVVTCIGLKFVHVTTCTSQPVQVTTSTNFLYTSCNLYITYIDH